MIYMSNVRGTNPKLYLFNFKIRLFDFKMGLINFTMKINPMTINNIYSQLEID